MPSLPPFARREQIATYQRACGGVEWREERISAKDGTGLGVVVGEVGVVSGDGEEAGGKGEGDEGMRVGERKRRRKKKRVVVVYFQGLVDFFFLRLFLALRFQGEEYFFPRLSGLAILRLR